MSDILDNRLLLSRLRRDEGYTIDHKQTVSTYILEVRLIKLVRANMIYLTNEDISVLKIKKVDSVDTMFNYIQQKIQNFSNDRLIEATTILECKGLVVLLLFLIRRLKRAK